MVLASQMQANRSTSNLYIQFLTNGIVQWYHIGPLFPGYQIYALIVSLVSGLLLISQLHNESDFR